MTAVSEPITKPQPLGLYAGDLFARAEEFLLVFEALVQDDAMRHARYFLLAHSIELAIKAFLAAKGVPKAKLRGRPYGHDIVFMWSEAGRLGLKSDTDLGTFVANTAEMNDRFDFRYPSGYRLHVWGPKSASDAMRRMLEAVHPAVEMARVDAELDFHTWPKATYQWED